MLRNLSLIGMLTPTAKMSIAIARRLTDQMSKIIINGLNTIAIPMKAIFARSVRHFHKTVEDVHHEFGPWKM